jgi:hypothetical protein
MSLISRLIGWAASLAPADTYDVAIECNIQVPMPDGVVLLASISSVELVAPASDRDLQNEALIY